LCIWNKLLILVKVKRAPPFKVKSALLYRVMQQRKIEQLPLTKQEQKQKLFADTFGSLKIKIPVCLSSAIAADYSARACLDTFILLKAFYTSGAASISLESRLELVALCGRDYKTINKRLLQLQQLQLLTITGEKIHLASWEKVAEVFKLKKYEHYKLRFFYVRYTGAIKVSDILEARFMYEKEKECKQAFYFKINKYEEIKRELETITGGTTAEAVEYSQLHHYTTEYRELSQNEKYVLFNIARGDTSLSYRKWSKYFGYTSKGAFAYKKRKLSKCGLITVERRAYELKGTHKTKQLRKSICGTAPYVPALGKVVFFMPDKIRYLSPSISSSTGFLLSSNVPPVEKQILKAALA